MKTIKSQLDEKELNNRLLDASIYGKFNEIKHLLRLGANIHYQDEHGNNAIIAATLNGYTDIVKYLLTSKDLKQKANPYHENELGKNALLWAAVRNHLDIVTFLIVEQNMRVNKKALRALHSWNSDEVLHIIKARELYQKMNMSLNIKEYSQKHKI